MPSFDLPQQVQRIALEYGLMSGFASFIAVDSSQKTPGSHEVTINIPVPVRHGVRYETTVEGQAD